MNILFLVFNRPNLTERVLKAINTAKPEKLYISADGPRLDVPNDFEKCNEVRKIIKEIADCPTVITRFRDTNFGPLHSVSKAINWFFNSESEGIILEDDCLPDPSFFPLCNELLIKYRNNENLFMISGSNFIPNYQVKSSYLFSRMALIWGWATWKRAWDKFDSKMEAWPSYLKTKDLDYFGSKRDLVCELINRAYLDPSRRTWNVLWRASFLINKGLCIIPRHNLIKNIGFGHPDATHHKKYHKVSDITVEPIEFPLTHPEVILPDHQFDQKSLDFYYDTGNDHKNFH